MRVLFYIILCALIVAVISATAVGLIVIGGMQ